MTVLKHVDFEVPNWGELAGGPVVRRDYVNAILDLSPLAYWRLGETSGTTVSDSSGNGHHGTYQSGVVLGQVGLLAFDSNPAADFPGGTAANTDSVTTPLSDAWLDNDFTIILWIRPDQVAVVHRECIGTESLIGNNKGFGFRLQSNATMTFFFNNGTTFTSIIHTSGVIIGELLMLAATYNATSGLLTSHKEGQPQATSTLTGGFSDSKSMNIGDAVTKNSRRWDGQIDEVAIFDSKLSDTQLLDLYRIGIGELYQG